MPDPHLRVLFLDDSPTQLKAAADALHKVGYEITTALNVAEAEPAVAHAHVVLVDYNMPGITGAEALRALKSRLPSTSPPPKFYLYTTDPSAARQYREIGFDGLFVLKGDVVALVKQMESVSRLLKTSAMRKAS